MTEDKTGLTETLKHPAQYVKAILAFAVPFIGSLAVAYEDLVITTGEWQTAAGVGITAAVAVFYAPNYDK